MKSGQIETALGHGAKGVVLDFVLAYDPATLELDGEIPLKRYDTRFLRLLRTETAAGRLALGTRGDLQPAERFLRPFMKPSLRQARSPSGEYSIIE